VGGAQFGTHWFYERARGQYGNAQADLSAAQRKQFQLRDNCRVAVEFVGGDLEFESADCVSFIFAEGMDPGRRAAGKTEVPEQVLSLACSQAFSVTLSDWRLSSQRNSRGALHGATMFLGGPMDTVAVEVVCSLLRHLETLTHRGRRRIVEVTPLRCLNSTPGTPEWSPRPAGIPGIQ
jgi:hypothetical protein